MKFAPSSRRRKAARKASEWASSLAWFMAWLARQIALNGILAFLISALLWVTGDEGDGKFFLKAGIGFILAGIILRLGATWRERVVKRHPAPQPKPVELQSDEEPFYDAEGRERFIDDLAAAEKGEKKWQSVQEVVEMIALFVLVGVVAEREHLRGLSLQTRLIIMAPAALLAIVLATAFILKLIYFNRAWEARIKLGMEDSEPD